MAGEQYNKVVIDGVTYIDLSSDSVTAATMLSGRTAHDKNGAPITGSIPSKSNATYTPTTTSQTINAGQYLSGNQIIAGDADLVAGNIKTGVDIFGVAGTFTSDANAVAGEILNSKIAYVKGNKVTGSMPNRGSNNVTVTDTTGTNIPSGYYDGGGKAVIDSTSASNLVPANIRSGVNILGVTGTLSSEDTLTVGPITTTSSFSQQIITAASEDLDYITQVTIEPISVTTTLTTGTTGYTVTVS